MNWYVLYTKSRCEKAVADKLAPIRYRSVLSAVKKKKTLERPMEMGRGASCSDRIALSDLRIRDRDTRIFSPWGSSLRLSLRETSNNQGKGDGSPEKLVNAI
jgi:hypothetical protein